MFTKCDVIICVAGKIDQPKSRLGLAWVIGNVQRNAVNLRAIGYGGMEFPAQQGQHIEDHPAEVMAAIKALQAVSIHRPFLLSSQDRAVFEILSKKEIPATVARRPYLSPLYMDLRAKAAETNNFQGALMSSAERVLSYNASIARSFAELAATNEQRKPIMLPVNTPVKVYHF